MKVSKTVTLTAEEINEMLVKHAQKAIVTLNVPRKDDGELTATAEIGNAELKVAFANALEVNLDELDDMKVSKKRDGSCSVTF